MKKLVTLGLAAVMGTALVTGCQKKETMETTTKTEQQPAVVQETGTTATMTTTTETATTGTAMTGTETTATMAPPSTTTTTTATTTTETKKKM